MNYNIISPFQTFSIAEIKSFLNANDLDLDRNIDLFVEFRCNDEIIACGGLDHSIIKCVAIKPAFRGSGLLLDVMRALFYEATSRGITDLFLYTKPENSVPFNACGFNELVSYEHVVLMENSKDNLFNYCTELKSLKLAGDKIGSIVLNANPFTLGHQYLITQAAQCCDWLHVFVVKEDASIFRFNDRIDLIKKGVENTQLKNIIVHEGSNYIISRASFPNYFIKDEQLVNDSCTAIDLTLFRNHIAPALGINYRFVGTEPLDRVTNQYNQDMKFFLQENSSFFPKITVMEIPRIATIGDSSSIISASAVREALRDNCMQQVREMVPDSTYDFLIKNKTHD